MGSPKAVTALESAGKGRAPLMPSQLPPRPPLSVAALNLRTWTNPATGAAEIVAASVVHMAAVRQDVPLKKVPACLTPAVPALYRCSLPA